MKIYIISEYYENTLSRNGIVWDCQKMYFVSTKVDINEFNSFKKYFQLSYDYKFNLEDEKSKIPCLCGAVNCLKWMN